MNTIVQLLVYNSAKEILQKNRMDFDVLGHVICSVVSTGCVVATMNPLDVVSSRLSMVIFYKDSRDHASSWSR